MQARVAAAVVLEERLCLPLERSHRRVSLDNSQKAHFVLLK